MIRWLHKEDISNRSRLEDARNILTVALAEDEITVLTLERWQLSITEEQTFGPKTDEEDFEFLNSAVDLLFDILPAIRAIRRQTVLQAEFDSESRGSDKPGVVPNVEVDAEVDAEAAENATIELIDTNLQLARDLEREIQTMSQLSMPTKKLAADTIRNFEQCTLAAMDDAKVPEVMKRQKELSRAFGKFSVAPLQMFPRS